MQSRLIILAIAAALTVPTLATATWGAKGAWEPDTALDRTGTFMEDTPDTTLVGPGVSPIPKRVVYLNGIQGFGQILGATMINPNSAAVGSQILIPASYNAQALLGVWKDCNKDGYIGWGDNALFEYRSALLGLPNMNGVTAGESVCKKDPLGAVKPRGDHSGYTNHNDGDWVREFIPIGPEVTLPTQTDINQFNIPDNGARVWADWGLPGAKPGFICWLSAHPRDSTHSVGGIVDIVDCYSRGRINATLATHPVLGQTYTNSRGSNCRDSDLGALPGSYRTGCQPWGYQEDGALVDVSSDCSAPLASRTLPNGAQVRVPRPSPTTNSKGTGTNGPSVAGTIYQLDNDVSDCNPDDGSEWNLEDTPYQTEDDLLNQNAGRIVNDFVLTFVEDPRPAPLPLQVTNNLGRGTERDLGTRLVPQGAWTARSISTFAHNPFVDIDSTGLRPVRYLTFYARVGEVAISDYNLQLPSAVVGTYGSEACGTAIGPGQPDKAFWKCDPAKWWPQTWDEMKENGVAIGMVDGEEIFMGAKVGDAYTLRDVDCYDESVTVLRAEGISWGSVTQSACA